MIPTLITKTGRNVVDILLTQNILLLSKIKFHFNYSLGISLLFHYQMKN